MTKVVKYNEIVEEILEEDEASRDCDYKLYFELINKINKIKEKDGDNTSK